MRPEKCPVQQPYCTLRASATMLGDGSNAKFDKALSVLRRKNRPQEAIDRIGVVAIQQVLELRVPKDGIKLRLQVNVGSPARKSLTRKQRGIILCSDCLQRGSRIIGQQR